MEIEKNKKSKSKRIALALVIVLLLLVVAVSFAYYYAVLKGENVNTSKMGTASLVYTEPDIGTETVQMSDYKGIKNSTPYEFTVTGSATGSTILNYAIYLEEVTGNTVDKENIRYYLADENNMPLSGVGSPYPESDSNVVITPDGEEKRYNYYTDVSVKNGSNAELFTGQLTNVDPYDYLLLYYAGSVLGLEEGETFYIEKGGEEENICYNATYNEADQVITLDYENIAESSNCTVFYDTSDGYKIKNKSDESVLYTATYSDEYIEFEDENNTKFNGDILSYIAEQQNVQSNGSFYVKRAYTIQNPDSSELEEVGSYCMKYTVDPVEGYFSDELASSSSCSNAYVYVEGSVYASTLGHLDQKTDGKYSSISNIVGTDSIYFMEGKATLNGKGDTYYDQRTKNPLRTYKLRYWISDIATDNIGNTATETTPTTEGKKHTVEFGGTGIFKFKVNVYAYQESYGQLIE